MKRNPDGTWPKGVSGNPAGPPTGHIKLTAILRRRLEQPASSDTEFARQATELGLDPATTLIGELVVRSWISSAIDGAHPPTAEIFNRVEGKVTEKIELEGGPRVLQIALEEATKPGKRTDRRETPDGVSVDDEDPGALDEGAPTWNE